MKQRSGKRLLAAAALVSAVAVSSGPVYAGYTITVDPENAGTFHEGVFEGWGTSLCWWANRIGYDEVLTEKAAKLFFDASEGLGLNIVRYNIGGGDDPSHHHIERTDSAMPGFWTNARADEEGYAWEYDFTQDENQRNVLLAARKAAGEDFIAEAFSNSPPYFMTESGCSGGSADAFSNNLKADAVDSFAQYLTDVAVWYKEEHDLVFQSITGMNEPYTDYWRAMNNKQEGCHVDQGDAQSAIITSLREHLDAAGLTEILLSGTDETSIDTQITSYEKLTDAAKQTISRIDTHSYGGSRREALRKLAEAEGKNLWMSEVDGGDVLGSNAGEMGAALWLGQRIVDDMNGLRPSAWILWQVIDSHISKDGMNGNKDSGQPDFSKGFWGLATADHDNHEVFVSMKYYAMGQFTRFIRPGCTIIAGDRRSLAAYDPENKEIILVVVNDSSKDLKVRVDLSAFNNLSETVNVVRTSGSLENGEHWAELEPLIADESGFDAELKSQSITTYRMTAELQ